MNIVTDRRRDAILRVLKVKDPDSIFCVGPNTGMVYTDTGKTYVNLHVKLDDLVAQDRAEQEQRRKRIKELRAEVKEYTSCIVEKSKMPEDERGPAWDLYMHDMNVRLRELNAELADMCFTTEEEEVTENA